MKDERKMIGESDYVETVKELNDLRNRRLDEDEPNDEVEKLMSRLIYAPSRRM